jgi:hypothetical protein
MSGDKYLAIAVASPGPPMRDGDIGAMLFAVTLIVIICAGTFLILTS